MERQSKTILLAAAVILLSMNLTGCKDLLKLVDNGPGYLPGGPLKIAYRTKDVRANGAATHCFDIHNPTRRAIAEIRIGTGWKRIPWRSGENISGSRTPGQMDYWNPSMTPNDPAGNQMIVIKRQSSERARDASRQPHLGEVCYATSEWVMKSGTDFSKLQHQVTYD